MQSLSILAIALMLPGQDVDRKCGFSPQRRSLLDRYDGAPMLVVGRLQNAVLPNNALPHGQVELVLDEVLIPHAALKGRKSILIPQHREASAAKFLVALDLHKGEFEAYAGTPIDDKGQLVKFVVGALQLKNKTPLERARFHIEYLRDANIEVASSALVELSNITYSDLRKAAQTQKPEPWLEGVQEAKRHAQRDISAMILAHCGRAEHALIVRKLIDGRDSVGESEALLFCYVMLDRENGWSFLSKYVSDGRNSFLKRYSALRAIRLIADERPDVIELKKCVEAFAGIFNVPDMADFAIEEMRKRERWEYCETILDLNRKKEHDSKATKRSILRYALQCPSPVARAFVIIERARDPEFVATTEELLALEPSKK